MAEMSFVIQNGQHSFSLKSTITAVDSPAFQESESDVLSDSSCLSCRVYCRSAQGH